ncbi:MAG: VWA domain-containing protein [Acidobacteria bacterium]|nr:VWA domain-containing protein [Acidobacteriota bacterium]
MSFKSLIFFAAMIPLLFSAFASGQKQKDDQVIRVAVDMISLPVVVTTKDGRRVTDLKKEDFQIFENGAKQEIAGFAATDEPICVALALDTSGSTELKLARIQNAAIKFVHQLHPDDEVAVMSFADDVRLQEDFTIDRDKNEYGIKKTRTGGWTVLYEAVWLALEDVLKPIRERKALVLFRDGVDTHSGRATMNETLDLARESPATIYCIYFDTERDQYEINRRSSGRTLPPVIWNPLPPVTGGSSGPSPEEYQRGKAYLNGLAEYSGGIVLDGTNDLDEAFAQIAKELASQYSIGYYSSDPRHDGKFRKVQVKLNKEGLVARTKKGYYTKKDKKK